jgi:queuine/archaeosine tRNA-ribosyltransferase
VTDHRIDQLLTQHRRHLAHQQRELYERNIDEPCPCELCGRARFEHRATMAVIGIIVATAFVAWMVLWSQA